MMFYLWKPETVLLSQCWVRKPLSRVEISIRIVWYKTPSKCPSMGRMCSMEIFWVTAFVTSHYEYMKFQLFQWFSGSSADSYHERRQWQGCMTRRRGLQSGQNLSTNKLCNAKGTRYFNLQSHFKTSALGLHWKDGFGA